MSPPQQQLLREMTQFGPFLANDEVRGRFVPHFPNPLYEDLVQPETSLPPGHEAEMPAMLHCNQPQPGVLRKRRMIVNLKRNQRIVLSLHQKCWNANALQKLVRRLCGVIVVRSAESECERSELVIEFVDALHAVEVFNRKQSGCQSFLEPDALLEAAEESVGINEVHAQVEVPDTSRQIDGR